MTVRLSDSSKKYLKKLDKHTAKLIAGYLHKIEKLQNPRSQGKCLVGDLSNLWRYRCGDYRILCNIQDDVLEILVVKIGHRREVYKRS